MRREGTYIMAFFKFNISLMYANVFAAAGC